jgi:hypothetical protein
VNLHEELLDIVAQGIAGQPRSLQKRVGPSELGIPCDRKLGYKLLGHPVLNPRDSVPWKPFIGTGLHSEFEVLFHKVSAAGGDVNAHGGRYLVENRVNVGEILGQDITGSCDLYVNDGAGTVVDFKCVGDEQLRKYKAHGPGDQYRKQAHLYGRGWTRQGMPVATVAIWFLPRNQELRQNYWWSEPYDEQVAVDTLIKAEGIAKLTGALGPQALSLLGTAEDYCSFCDWFRPGSTDLNAGCPGVPRDFGPSSLQSLIAK